MNTMNTSESTMDNTVFITKDTLLPIVKKYFKAISAAQWALLATGPLDTDTVSILADLITEVIQTATLKTAQFIIEECLARSESSADTSAPLETLKAQLGVSLNGSFADALHIPMQTCESADTLTEMVVREVSQKVNSVVPTVISCPDWPEKPAILNLGNILNTVTLRRMVYQASSCLKGYLDKLEYRCQCWRPKSPKTCECPDHILESEELESTENIKSAISVHSVIKAVTDILVSRSNENPEVAHTPSFLTILDAEAAAPEIVRNALETLHYPDIEDSATSNVENLVPTPHFNMRSIVGKVRDFYTSIHKDTTDNSQTARRLSFLKFSKNQYEKMMGQLMRASDKEHQDFLVSLRQDSGSSQRSLTEEDEANKDILEQTVPESPMPKSEAGSQSNMGSTAEIKELSSVDFKTIKIDLDSLFQQLISPDKPAVPGTKTLENTMTSEHIRTLAKELTDKLWDHLMSIQTFQRSAAPMTRSLSDSVISEVRREVDATAQVPFSPDVMYVMTEDAVRKFLQQVLLWVDMEPSNKSSRSNAVHSALKDIEELMTKTLTPAEDENIIEPEDENVIEPEDNVIEPENKNVIELEDENVIEPEDENVIELEDENVIKPEDENVIEPDTCLVLSFEESINGLSVVPTNTSTTRTHTAQRTITKIITSLVRRMIRKAPEKTKNSLQTEDINAIIKRLTDKAQDEINIPGSALRKIKPSIKKVKKAVMEDLKWEFGSHEQLLEAALGSDLESFDDAFVKQLKRHLNALFKPNKKEAAVSFLRAVGKVLIKPFRCCFMGFSSE